MSLARHRGFTLVEMMVSLALLSMLVVATLAAIRTLGNTQARLDDVSDQVDEKRLVMAYFKRTLGQFVPVRRAVPDELTGIFFYGTATDLVWVSPTQAGWGGLHVHRLSWSEGGELRIQLDGYRSPREEPVWDELEYHLLADNIEALEITYRAPPESQWVEAEWVTEWPMAAEAPTHIRVDLRSNDRPWPPLILALSGGDRR